jgi:hypothetical protein
MVLLLFHKRPDKYLPHKIQQIFIKNKISSKIFLRNFNAYTEFGLGYARDLNERLTIGSKFRLLLSIGNLNMNINRIAVETSGITNDISERESWKLVPLFAGTDYMYFGKNSEVINAFVGITIPLGKKASASTF